MYYPDTLPVVARLANGDVVLPGNAGILPAAASCPPDFTWSLTDNACVPSPGTENINYQCGSALAPWGQNGCNKPTGLYPAVPAPAPPIVRSDLVSEQTDRYADWSACHPTALSLDKWLASLKACASASASPAASSASSAVSSAVGAFGCLLVGVAVLGAVSDVLGGGGRR